MIQRLFAVIDKPSERKLTAFLLGFTVLVLNDPLHLSLDHTEQALIASFVGGYIGVGLTKDIISLKRKKAEVEG